ncbi:MAG: hypothetical protein JWL59_1577 [Chthoniobacteraceae bacterium]|nr:hypothetical protein [Chthoniobacteraceae bacterium]
MCKESLQLPPCFKPYAPFKLSDDGLPGVTRGKCATPADLQAIRTPHRFFARLNEISLIASHARDVGKLHTTSSTAVETIGRFAPIYSKAFVGLINSVASLMANEAYIEALHVVERDFG